MEHRCCIEFLNIQGKLVFDGSLENLDCIIQHEEYKAITNRAILENVATLLRHKNGRSYRRRSGVAHEMIFDLLACEQKNQRDKCKWIE